MSRQFNIRSQSREQVDSIADGPKNAVARYLPVNEKVLVTLAKLVEVARLPAGGMARCSVQLEASYPHDAASNGVSQVEYEIVSYRDAGSPVLLRSGTLSPFYDKLVDNFAIRCESIGLRFATPNIGTAVARPIVCQYTVVMMAS